MSERLQILKKQILETKPLVVIGGMVPVLGEARLMEYATQVSEKLAGHPNKMLPYSEQQILEAMMRSRGVVVTNPETGRLQAFAQIWDYGETQEGKKVLEFGSWSSFDENSKGRGKWALKGGILLGNLINPHAQLIAIVEEKNLRAQEIIIKEGGIEIPGLKSPFLRTVVGESAWMKRFDITLRGGD